MSSRGQEEGARHGSMSRGILGFREGHDDIKTDASGTVQEGEGDAGQVVLERRLTPGGSKGKTAKNKGHWV